MLTRTAPPRYWGLLLAGGSGERLWPWSRRGCPKQFLAITGRRTLLQASYARLRRLMPRDQIFVIGSAGHAALVRRQLPRLPAGRWIGEPIGRNTAAAVGLGALLIGREDPGAVMVVVTADHVIEPDSGWVATVRAAAHLALEDVDRLVCIGIPPTAPVTGYGYLVPSRRRKRVGSLWTARLGRYVEKPSKAVAQRLIRQGASWNSGMFVWTIPAIARALQRYLPSLPRGLVTTVRAEVGTAAFRAQLARLYRRLPSVSIDDGVMEQADDCWMVPARFRWDDVGSWASVWRYLPNDRRGNAVRGPHVGVRTTRSLVLSDPDQLIATLGLRDLIIVRHAGATLVAHRSEVQRIRQLVARCQQKPRWRRCL